MLEDVGLKHALLEKRVLQEQLLDNLIAKVEVIDAVAELLLRNDIAAAIGARASHREGPSRRHLDDLLHPEDLVLTQQVELQGLGLVRGDQSFELRVRSVQPTQLQHHAGALGPHHILDLLTLDRRLSNLFLQSRRVPIIVCQTSVDSLHVLGHLELS